MHNNQYTYNPVSLEERFWEKVNKMETCWLWTATIRSGYGQFTVGRKNVSAHRYAFELVHGLIPEGLQLDHLCRVRHCVNPAHLEVVTHRTNTLRGVGPTAVNSRKVVCSVGHPLAGTNLRKNKTGYRQCRACANSHQAASRRKVQR